MQHSKLANVALWIVQALLTALFLFAGAFKLIMPAAELARQTGLPTWFMRFISLAELAGGIGLLLPGVVSVHRGLTPLAASGLIAIMVGAVVVSALRVSTGAAVMPFVVSGLLLTVVIGRREWMASISRSHARHVDRRRITGARGV